MSNRGIKFLNPAGCTEYEGREFVYNLPQRGERWSAWTEHPTPAAPDGKSCGPGRLHTMNRLDARYAPANWWPWWAEGKGLIGEDDEKSAFAAVRLCRITPHVFWRMLRLGWGRRADLYEAYLHGADLRGADLHEANLSKADLSKADLHEADLSGANLSKADLHEADLSGANLSGADLTRAYLRGAIGIDKEGK